MENDESCQAIVQSVIRNGRHGAYVVATCEKLGTVTFSLQPEVWKENDVPQPGVYVMLSVFRKKRAGWRAEHGRYVKPSDQVQSSSQFNPKKGTEQ